MIKYTWGLAADDLVVHSQFCKLWQRPLDGKVDRVPDVLKIALHQAIYHRVFVLRQFNTTGILLSIGTFKKPFKVNLSFLESKLASFF
jgi:hypothetical protein